MADELLTEVKDGVGIITFNRPEKLNAMSSAMVVKLDETWREWENDDRVRVVIVTGAGEKAFSAGGDIFAEVKEEDPSMKPEEKVFGGNRLRVFQAAYPKPTIGAINGLAYGGGAVMAAMFDMRVGCENTSFCFVGAKRGRIMCTGTLPLIVGWPKAKEILLSAKVVKADEAYHCGLLNHLVRPSEVMNTAMEIAVEIAANDPRLVRGIKEVINQNVGMSVREMSENERKARNTFLQAPPISVSFGDFIERKGKQ